MENTTIRDRYMLNMFLNKTALNKHVCSGLKDWCSTKFGILSNQVGEQLSLSIRWWHQVPYCSHKHLN